MQGMNRFKQYVTAVTVAGFLALGTQAPANAAVIGTAQWVAQTDRATNLNTVREVLERSEVKAQLESLGVDPAQAAARVAALSDQELARMAGEMADLPAGGDALAVIGIVFLVLVLLEVVGVIDIFKRT